MSSEEMGQLFKTALEAYAQAYKDQENVCGVKLDLRPQGFELTVGIRFIDGENHFSFCSATTNCEEAEDADFALLNDILHKIGVNSESGAKIMIKRNAEPVYEDENCHHIEPKEDGATDSETKRAKFLGLF